MYILDKAFCYLVDSILHELLHDQSKQMQTLKKRNAQPNVSLSDS